MLTQAQCVPRTNVHSCANCSLLNQCLAPDEGDGEVRPHITAAPRIYHRGEHLFRCTDSFSVVYMVRSGAAKTYVICPNGEEQVIGFHYPGDMVGLEALETGEYSCCAEILDTSSVCRVPLNRLTRACGQSKTSQSRLLQAVSRKIQRDQSLSLMLRHKSADQRVAAFLLDIAAAQERQGFSSSALNLPMSRADIGSYLALAVETVSRVLTRLQSLGILSVERNNVRIRDRDACIEIAQDTSVCERASRGTVCSLH